MATYKKRGAKKSITTNKETEDHIESTTAEVFETLDTSASRTEEWVVKYQNFILGAIGFIAIGVIGYLGYENFIVEPKEKEAVSELNQAQYYFELAVNSIDSDSLFNRALNGGEGKYGFLDIIDNYKGTSAAKLAIYSAGMSYLNLKDYENAIFYLKQFSADDVLLSALSHGSIGDAFAQLEKMEDSYDWYVKAFNNNNNLYTTPKYLYKAAIIGADIGKLDQSISFLKRIEKEFPNSNEGKLTAVQIGRLETLSK